MLYFCPSKFYNMKLTLREKLVLLFHHELKDRFSVNDYRFDTAFAGAILFELIALKQLEISKHKLVAIGSAKGLSKDLKEVYKLIEKNEKHKKVCYWVAYISERAKNFRNATLKQMAKEGLLSVEIKRSFLFFTKETTHLHDSSIRQEIFQDLRAVLLDGKKPSFDELALICLIDSADVYRLISNVKGECPKMKEKFKALVGEDVAGQGVTEAVEMVNSAVFTALYSDAGSSSCMVE